MNFQIYYLVKIELEPFPDDVSLPFMFCDHDCLSAIPPHHRLYQHYSLGYDYSYHPYSVVS